MEIAVSKDGRFSWGRLRIFESVFEGFGRRESGKEGRNCCFCTRMGEEGTKTEEKRDG